MRGGCREVVEVLFGGVIVTGLGVAFRWAITVLLALKGLAGVAFWRELGPLFALLGVLRFTDQGRGA